MTLLGEQRLRACPHHITCMSHDYREAIQYHITCMSHACHMAPQQRSTHRMFQHSTTSVMALLRSARPS